jgi:hypothetical protein
VHKLADISEIDVELRDPGEHALRLVGPRARHFVNDEPVVLSSERTRSVKVPPTSIPSHFTGGPASVLATAILNNAYAL